MCSGSHLKLLLPLWDLFAHCGHLRKADEVKIAGICEVPLQVKFLGHHSDATDEEEIDLKSVPRHAVASPFLAAFRQMQDILIQVVTQRELIRQASGMSIGRGDCKACGHDLLRPQG